MQHGIIWWIIVGLIAGFLTGKIMKGSGFGALDGHHCRHRRCRYRRIHHVAPLRRLGVGRTDLFHSRCHRRRSHPYLPSAPDHGKQSDQHVSAALRTAQFADDELSNPYRWRQRTGMRLLRVPVRFARSALTLADSLSFTVVLNRQPFETTGFSDKGLTMPSCSVMLQAMSRRSQVAAMCVLAWILLSLRSDGWGSRVRPRMEALPSLTLWTWERREDLSGIDPASTAVASLDRTVFSNRTLDPHSAPTEWIAPAL